MYVCMYVCMHACIYVCMHACMHECNMYVYMYVECVYTSTTISYNTSSYIKKKKHNIFRYVLVLYMSCVCTSTCVCRKICIAMDRESTRFIVGPKKDPMVKCWTKHIALRVSISSLELHLLYFTIVFWCCLLKSGHISGFACEVDIAIQAPHEVVLGLPRLLETQVAQYRNAW